MVLSFRTIVHLNDNNMDTEANVTISVNIRKTCPCNIYPLKPHFYIVKLGYAEVNLFFLFLLENIDCGYSLERLGGSNKYPQSMFWSKNKKNRYTPAYPRCAI